MSSWSGALLPPSPNMAPNFIETATGLRTVARVNTGMIPVRHLPQKIAMAVDYCGHIQA